MVMGAPQRDTFHFAQPNTRVTILAPNHYKHTNTSNATSGETLCRDNGQLIGMSLIGLARQVQKNRD